MTMVRGTQFLCFLLCVSSVILGAADIEKRGLKYLQETMGIAGHPTMSSEWSEGYSAAKCMDGNWDTYCYNKGGDDKPFFAVELPASVRINQVRLITANSYPEKAENIVVIVTNDISSSGTQLGSTFKGPATKGKEFITFKSETGVTGKYVVVKQGKGVITFAEVQVNPEEMCTGRYRTPSGTKCVGMCQIKSGYWGNSWCYTNQTNGGPWGAPCKKCSDVSCGGYMAADCSSCGSDQSCKDDCFLDEGKCTKHDDCYYYDCSEGNLDMTKCCGNATHPSTEGLYCHGINKGVPWGKDPGCCTPDTRCKVGDGDCNQDLDCEGDLVCGKDNCAWGGSDDCCEKPGPNAPKKMRCEAEKFDLKNLTCEDEKEKYCKISEDNTMCKYCGFGDEEKCIGTCDYGITDPADIKLIVDRHNEIRRKVAKGLEEGGREGKKGQPPAANMMEVEWDPEVAKVAQTWVNQCIWGHDSRGMESGYCGQNGASAAGGGYPHSGKKERKNLAKFVNMWHGEVNNIDSDCVDSFCKGNSTGTVGHYTQVVWATSVKIGCGFRYYHKGGWSGTYVFCNYCPGGNMGGAPIYKVGEPGSECPDGSTNVDGLCRLDKLE